MKVGCLGDVVFQVSDKVIETLEGESWTSSARITEHKIHGKRSVTEFEGVDADKFKFKLYISHFLGVDVMKEIEKLLDYERNGKAVPLVIGQKKYGFDLWLIKGLTKNLKKHGGDGTLLSAEITVNLLAYERTC